MSKPDTKPPCPNFSSGPTAKRPGYTLDGLQGCPLGRSHRSAAGMSKLRESLDLTHELLELPEGYLVGIVPASDTGAVEMAMWNMLGPKPVEVCFWDAFGKSWWTDVTKQLKLDAVEHSATYGQLPDFSRVNFDNDVIMTWNGTTSGVCMLGGEQCAVPEKHEGLVICDATSAVFAMPMPWNRLDVVTFSWQKALGGEAGHGMMILSPRAVQRVQEYSPAWPVPKVLCLRSGGSFNNALFRGSVINTVSMLCVEDYLDALRWVQRIGGVQETYRRCQRNFAVMKAFVESRDWCSLLSSDQQFASPTSFCFVITKGPQGLSKAMAGLLAEEDAAYDIASYRDAPEGLRVWCGPTVETSDLEALLPWLDWAFEQCNASMSTK